MTKTAPKHPTEAEGPSSTDSLASSQQTAAEARKVEGGATEVVYVGDAGTREISKADWRAAGVEDQETVTWNADNEYRVPADQFTEQALQVLTRDRNLKIK